MGDAFNITDRKGYHPSSETFDDSPASYSPALWPPAREEHFPATIADLYDSDNMPANLREAHERNDEVLERIYIGRRFRNDAERLEKLFDLYTKMTAGNSAGKKTKAGANA